MAVMGHSRLGASSCKRWITCTGSVALNEQVETSNTSKYAAEGTVAHSICEYYLYYGLPQVPTEKNGRLGSIVEQDDFAIEVTAEMLDACYLYANTIFDDMIARGLTSDNGNKHRKKTNFLDLNIETQFTLSSISEDLGGTNDASVYSDKDGRLTVYDFKYGKGIPVEAERNEQLMFYALGVCEKKNITPKVVELVIIQPRCQHEDGPIRRYEMSFEELMQFRSELALATSAIQSGRTTLVSGPHCRFCKAKAFCEEYRNGVNEAAQMDFAPVATTATALPIEPPKAEALDPSTISRILNKASMVKDFIEAVEERAFELLNNGIDIPGYKLVHKRVNRQWIDESSVEIAFGEKAYTKKIKTPAQLEKEVGKEAILDYVTTPEAGLTLVPETDKREKVVPLIEVFDCGTDNQPLDI